MSSCSSARLARDPAPSLDHPTLYSSLEESLGLRCYFGLLTGVLGRRQSSMGDFPKVRSSSLDEPGIELLSWAVLTLSSNCQPGGSVSVQRLKVGAGLSS